MKVENIKNINDMERYLEGCLNDFELGISTKGETMGCLIDYTIKVVELTKERLSKTFNTKEK